MLIALGLVFAPLSLLSFGGGNAVIADIAQQAIAVQGWTSEREFADLFALSRAAPGPGSMLAALIGWKAAGIVRRCCRDSRLLCALGGTGLRGRAALGPLARLGMAYRRGARHDAGCGRTIPVGRSRGATGVARRARCLGRGHRDDGRIIALAEDASGAAIARRGGTVWPFWRILTLSRGDQATRGVQPGGSRGRPTARGGQARPHNRLEAIAAPSAMVCSFLNEMSGSSLP